jgi:hypothetical protein
MDNRLEMRMLRVGPNGFLRPDEASAEIERLKHLVADLEAMASGDGPTMREISEAPYLDQWVVGRQPSPCLIGLVTGHPRLSGSDRAVRTSEMMVLDQDEQWARTLSRFFRLGSRARTDR